MGSKSHEVVTTWCSVCRVHNSVRITRINAQPKAPSFDKESEYSFKEIAKKMDGHSSAGSTPKMDWSSGDLPSAWKAFKQHREFTLGGPLKQKSEEVKCNYLPLWVGDQGQGRI